MPGTARLDLFYPILPDADWLARLVPLGVRLVQLRFKSTNDGEIRRQIQAAMEVCRRHDCQLIVNDHWRQAIALGADYVHLGQDDLAGADLAAIRAAQLRLGVSTHSEEELAIAMAAKPDYVALGPIYETKLKKMPWAPQGLQRIARWKELCALPLVAIGGITCERAGDVIAHGANSAAVVTDLVTHADPEARTREWLAWRQRARTG